MAVSKAVVPILKGDAAKSFRKTLDSSTIKPYSKSERIATEKAISEVLKKRDAK